MKVREKLGEGRDERSAVHMVHQSSHDDAVIVLILLSLFPAFLFFWG